MITSNITSIVSGWGVSDPEWMIRSQVLKQTEAQLYSMEQCRLVDQPNPGTPHPYMDTVSHLFNLVSMNLFICYLSTYFGLCCITMGLVDK